jgi:hypothetical protein
MIQSNRVAFLALLSVAVYTLSLFISFQKLLFPFPLFDPILWTVTLAVFYIQVKELTWRKVGMGAYAFLLYIQLKLVSNPFIVSFFIPFKGTEEYFDLPSVQLARLLSQVLLFIALAFWFTVDYRKSVLWLILFVLAFLFVQFFSFNYTHFLICPFSIIPFFILHPNNSWKHVILVHAVFDVITLYYLLK